MISGNPSIPQTAECGDTPNIRHHCGDITTDIVCPHCGRWLVEVFSD